MNVVQAELPGPDATFALVFPGQGSQHVGMGKTLYEASEAARKVFHEADEVLGFQLSKLCFEGPAEELEDTINAQPAILTVSMACLAALREKWDEVGRTWRPRYVAGHSLGEYSALVAAGVLDFTDALRLVRERGRLMKEQGDSRPGGMAAVIGLEREDLEAICDEATAASAGIVSVANANSPGQYVISGDLEPLNTAIELAKERGARTVLPLRISIASHSPLMHQAAARLAVLLDRATIREPQVPIVANVAGQILTTADQIRGHLGAQMVAPVEWVGSVRNMVADGVDTFVEIGPGQVLSRLIKRISEDVRALSLNDAGVAQITRRLTPRAESSS